jgi:hypothetical protein
MWEFLKSFLTVCGIAFISFNVYHLFFRRGIQFFFSGGKSKSSVELNKIYFDEIKSFLKAKDFKIYNL